MNGKQTTKSTRSITLGSPVRNVEPKTIAAVILVAVMGVLWVRVLFRSGTATASAATGVNNLGSAQTRQAESGIKIKPVKLAQTAGRQDVIADDFFKADRCSVWNRNAAAEVQSAKPGENQQRLNDLIKVMALEAIIKNAAGYAEKACINGVIVTSGSVLEVKIKGETYSVRIVAVEPDRVQLSWQDQSIVLEMPDQKMN